MTLLERKGVGLTKRDWSKLRAALLPLGFSGRGATAKFLRKVADPKQKILFIESGGEVKVTISRGEKT